MERPRIPAPIMRTCSSEEVVLEILCSILSSICTSDSRNVKVCHTMIYLPTIRDDGPGILYMTALIFEIYRNYTVECIGRKCL